MNQIAIREPAQKMMLLEYMANKYDLNPDEFSKTVRATCGLSTATAEQFAAFLIVAKQYSLNPLTKEIYAFPGRGGGIVPIVSIDGWVNLVNSHPHCDGFDMVAGLDPSTALVSYTCTMYRKDRAHPVVVTEYLSECVRQTDPWKMKHRMLRHKALIQAARYAFGFAGIYDEDEGRTIAEAVDVTPRRVPGPADSIEHTVESSEKPSSEISGDPVDDMPDTVGKAPTGPHIIIGDHYTAKTWAEAYIAAVQTSPDTETVFKWTDANAAQLKKLGKSAFAKVEKAVSDHTDMLRGATAPAKTKGSVPDFDKDYDGWVAFYVKSISEAVSVDQIEELFAVIESNWGELFPPDKAALDEARSAAEERLAP